MRNVVLDAGLFGHGTTTLVTVRSLVRPATSEAVFVVTAVVTLCG